MAEKKSSQRQKLTHLDESGAARMVEVGQKQVTQRKAIARGFVVMKPSTLKLLCEQKLPKGDALQVARIAGIMAAKKTPDLIPLCHPIALSGVDIDIEAIAEDRLQIDAEVRNQGKTGVEMEALTACSIACLTIYDMAKAVDPAIEIHQIHLLEKEGGKRGHWHKPIKKD